MDRYGPSGRYRHHCRCDSPQQPQRNRLPGQHNHFNKGFRRPTDDRHYQFDDHLNDNYERDYYERRGHPSDYRSSRRTLRFDDHFYDSPRSGGDLSNPHWQPATEHRPYPLSSTESSCRHGSTSHYAQSSPNSSSRYSDERLSHQTSPRYYNRPAPVSTPSCQNKMGITNRGVGVNEPASSAAVAHGATDKHSNKPVSSIVPVFPRVTNEAASSLPTPSTILNHHSTNEPLSSIAVVAVTPSPCPKHISNEPASSIVSRNLRGSLSGSVAQPFTVDSDDDSTDSLSILAMNEQGPCKQRHAASKSCADRDKLIDDRLFDPLEEELVDSDSDFEMNDASGDDFLPGHNKEWLQSLKKGPIGQTCSTSIDVVHPVPRLVYEDIPVMFQGPEEADKVNRYFVVERRSNRCWRHPRH
jgi:hypothetical protein